MSSRNLFVTHRDWLSLLALALVVTLCPAVASTPEKVVVKEPSS